VQRLTSRMVTRVAAMAVLVISPTGAPSSWAHPALWVTAATTTASVDTAGIPLVTTAVQSEPNSEAQAQALSDAYVFAENHPDDVGYPWIDPVTQTLELSSASTAGSGLLVAEAATMATKTAVRTVAFSFAQLQKMRDEVTTLTSAGVPDADLIYGISEDQQGDRIVIRVKMASNALFKELATRFGTEAIAVLVDPDSYGGSTASRQTDTSPYWGGALIHTPGLLCSDAFAWAIYYTAGNALLTAAHCIASGGNVTIDQLAGTVTASSDENWSTTAGTQYYTGQSIYRGDVALIRLKSGFSSTNQIYRGGVNSSTHSTVTGRRTRYSALNDWVLAGGARTGETGPYQVVDTHADWLYNLDCGNCWVKNITRAGADSPPCIDEGDSGGSVFVSPVGSGITAAGTISGWWNQQCGLVFTDIYLTYLGLPGDAWY